ncbi:hypothetical protein SRB5_41710 [Streptomyces sp. RB5]|uniref:Oxidoreductase n=1 Tax=Streptomyces smaragdinus TaxID=2585196 RepID=A0A7K0CKS3_9ACTN|nr:oxidoreductase [Streptomyces smaragdinus]MQY14011.1 hypothetical protein [Streptomyces smaragdinus]
MLTFDELTPPERELWHAFPEGRRVDLGGAGSVRAEVITALLLGVNPPVPGAVAGVRLAGARITGTLDLAGAETAHRLNLVECVLEREVVLHSAATASLQFKKCRLPGIDATTARVSGTFYLKGTVFEGGRLNLNNARIAGELLLNGASFDRPGDWAVYAGGVEVQGGVFGRDGFTVRGGVRFAGARLHGGLFLEGARLSWPGGTALYMINATASTVVLDQGFAAEGDVALPGAQIQDLLTFDGADLAACPQVLLPRLHAVDLRFTPAVPPADAVDLSGTQVTVLHDTAAGWPERVRLEGLAYGTLRGRDGGDVPWRIGWLARDPVYSPQPYEQLAECYRRAGHDDDARRVLLARRRRQAATLGPAGRIWSRLLDVTVGHGYRPWLAGLWLAALCLAGSVVFAVSGREHAVKPGEGPPFHPFVYTLDLLIPIGGLGQRTAWYVEGGFAGVLSYVLIALGWVLTTTVVAGLSRVLGRN